MSRPELIVGSTGSISQRILCSVILTSLLPSSFQRSSSEWHGMAGIKWGRFPHQSLWGLRSHGGSNHAKFVLPKLNPVSDRPRRGHSVRRCPPTSTTPRSHARNAAVARAARRISSNGKTFISKIISRYFFLKFGNCQIFWKS